MVNKIILDYLKQNKDSYPLSSLKAKLLSKGYSEKDYNDALSEINSNPGSVDVVSPVNKDGFTLPKGSGFRWIRFAAIIGSAFIFLYLLGFVMSFFGFSMPSGDAMGWLMLLVCLISVVIFGFYLFGFFKVGQKTDSSILRMSSIIYLISFVLVVILTIAVILYMASWNAGFLSSDMGTGLTGAVVAGDIDFETDFAGGSSPIGAPLPMDDMQILSGGAEGAASEFAIPSLIDWKIGLFLAFIGLLIFIRGFFSSSLLSISSEVSFSLIAATFGIISFLGALIGFGYIVYLLANPIQIVTLIFGLDFGWIVWVGRGIYIIGFLALLFETLTLFNASKKYE